VGGSIITPAIRGPALRNISPTIRSGKSASRSCARRPRALPETTPGPANIPFARSASIGIYCAPMSDVTQLLSAIEAGDPQAALRKLAFVRMANEKAGQTLQPTALVHEAWPRIPKPPRSCGCAISSA
jgi:hypothetical protein